MSRGSKKSWQNQPATMTVIRNGKKMQLPINMGRAASKNIYNDHTAAAIHQTRENWGLKLGDLDPQIASQLRLRLDQGLVVLCVQPGSRAENTGLHQGDVIVGVNSAYYINFGV
jgi:predicted metalloprotease with PDZ domain